MRWLILAGYRYMTSWSSNFISEEEKRFFMGGRYSITTGEYNSVLVETRGVMSEERWEDLFSKLKTRKDEVVIFSHEAHKKSTYGSTIEILRELKLKMLEMGFSIYFQLFHGNDASKERNYPFWLVNQIEQKGAKKVIEEITWEELMLEAKGSCSDGEGCSRRSYKGQLEN